MRKSGDKDFLVVLQSLETILQAQTKKSKRQSPSRTPNNKTGSSPKKSNKKKMTNIDFQENNINQEIKKITPKSPPPKRPRKLCRKTKNDDLYMMPIKYSANSTPKKGEKSHQTFSPRVHKNEMKYSHQSPSTQHKHRVRHNSPSDQIDDNNVTYDYPYINQNYTSSQLNTLCIFFLRWMKRCTEKIEAESNKESETNQANTFSTNQSMGKEESNNNVQNKSDFIPKTLAESDEISIERVNCNTNAKANHVPYDKIEINVTPKSFKSSHPSSLNPNQNSKESVGRKKNSAKVTFSALTPQQEKKYLDYLHPNRRPNNSQGNSPNAKIKNSQKKMASKNTRNDDIEIKKVNKNRNNDVITNNKDDNIIQQTSINETEKNENNDHIYTNTTNDNNITNNEENKNLTNKNIKNTNVDSENHNDTNTNKDINTNAINTNNNSSIKNSNTNNTNNSNILNSGTNDLNSIDDTSKLDLEETSPLPKSNEVRKMPSIGESDLNNQPNSEDIHYDSYELSEKSLSLLPPQGEGEVTDFNPSNF